MSSPCWVKATEFANPDFRQAFDHYVDERDQFGGYLMRQALRISADDFYTVAVTPEEVPVCSPTGTAAATASAARFPFLVAVPFTVTEAVCDTRTGDGETQPSSCMTAGAITAFMDMVTSFHIILANFPQKNGHVSLSIQANHLRPMECGKSYIALSRVDKMGRRIVYSSVDFVEPTLPPVHDAEEAPLPTATTAELLTAVKSATVYSNVKHVKSMLSFS